MKRTSHAKSVLRELVNRIADQCVEQSREDLPDGVHLLEDLANASPAALRSKRRLMLHLLELDSQTVEVAAAIAENQQLRHEAFIEKRSSVH
jgi:hypothetical protein